MKQLFALLAILVLFASCQTSTKEQTLRVAATSVPHAEILENIKPDLKKEGINLEVIVVEDYNTPNRALADKEIDANFFQHQPFLDMQMKEFGYPLEVLTGVHLEPMGIYSKKIRSPKDLKDGATIAIPSDPSNESRALLLMEVQGLITLGNHSTTMTPRDIKSNPKHLKFVEIDSPLLARSLDDVDAAAITTNFALQAGLNPKKDALSIEDQHSVFTNIVVVRKGESQRPELQALKKALNSEKTKRFIDDKYQGALFAAFN